MAHSVVQGRNSESVVIWSSWSEFVAMGGYGFYVWGSVAMVVVVLVMEMIMLGRRRRAVFEKSARNNGGGSETAA